MEKNSYWVTINFTNIKSWDRYFNLRPLLPCGLLKETLQTLSLLFPQSADKAARVWLGKMQFAEQLDPSILHCGSLAPGARHITAFRYWRDRLTMLKQAFDDAEPKTVGQWWHDRRRGVQWYTFWVAVLVLVLTVVFGLVQCIEGGLQVYAAFHGRRR